MQGVGFRPCVFRLARAHGLKGWVNNASDGLHIAFTADEAAAQVFYAELLANPPALARITRHELRQATPEAFPDFRIAHSHSQAESRLLLPPDFALCADCRADLYRKDGRRSGYAFTSCTHCGPRYSIIKQLPYDREQTAMSRFPMCANCATEYHEPSDRRYYAQTNSCSNCRIPLTLTDAHGQVISQSQADCLQRCAALLQAGQIVAIKGIGGYLLCCDATNAEAIARLRQRKQRPSKPFALMYPSLAAVQADFQVSGQEAAALSGSVAPIVLLRQKAQAGQTLACEAIAPGLQRLGIMLPYTPLYELLLHELGRPIVATSGNQSGSPIAYEEAAAMEQLAGIADYFLHNERDILLPQDDSVLQYAPDSGQAVWLRRSRGLAPTYLNPGLAMPGQSLLAMGGMLKGSFALSHQGNTYISQYLGDLGQFDAQQNYKHTVEHFLQLFGAKPDIILADKHPQYPSTLLGQAWASEWQVPIVKVQHHLAHFGAVLGEHQLLDTEQAVLGVIWDGTGLGDDGQVWGGEFFTYAKYAFERQGHFSYFPNLLGDKMAQEPRLAALAACQGLPDAQSWLRPKFTATEWGVYQKLLAQAPKLQTSSVGRLFDAAASLLGLMDAQTYEGEAALMLEQLARAHSLTGKWTPADSYVEALLPNGQVPASQLMAGLLADMAQDLPKARIAAKFHHSLVHSIALAADRLGTKIIAFSGGVFQNTLLIDMIAQQLGPHYRLCFHEQLSPNDENIAFGQAICYHIQQRHSITISKRKDYVFSHPG